MIKNLRILAPDYVYNVYAYKNVTHVIISYIYRLHLQVNRHLYAEAHENIVMQENCESVSAETVSTLTNPSNSKRAKRTIQPDIRNVLSDSSEDAYLKLMITAYGMF